MLIWVIAGAIVVVGIVTIVIGLSTPASIGWFAYQPLANAVFSPEDALLLSRTTVLGFGVLTLGLLALAFLVGRHGAKRENR